MDIREGDFTYRLSFSRARSGEVIRGDLELFSGARLIPNKGNGQTFVKVQIRDKYGIVESNYPFSHNWDIRRIRASRRDEMAHFLGMEIIQHVLPEWHSGTVDTISMGIGTSTMMNKAIRAAWIGIVGPDAFNGTLAISSAYKDRAGKVHPPTVLPWRAKVEGKQVDRALILCNRIALAFAPMGRQCWWPSNTTVEYEYQPIVRHVGANVQGSFPGRDQMKAKSWANAVLDAVIQARSKNEHRLQLPPADFDLS